MPLFFSVYLDLLRVLAALTVYAGHMVGFVYGGVEGSRLYRFVRSLDDIGYDAVVVFFVLSGYVITFAAAEVEKTRAAFVINRMARILPVAWAAILLSYATGFIAHSYSIRYEHVEQLGHASFDMAINALFLNQLWHADIRPFGDGPYWTLTFEVWDYVFFAMLFFLPKRWRLIGAGLVCAVMGPKFILLLPVWLPGSWIYRNRTRWPLTQGAALALTVLPLVTYAALKPYHPRDLSYHWLGQRMEGWLGQGLDGAATFGWAWLLGILVAMHLYGARHLLALRFLEGERVRRIVRIMASYAFSLYLYHYPLYLFWESFIRRDLPPHMMLLLTNLVILPCVIVLAQQTEHRKLQARALLYRIYGWLSGRRDAGLSSAATDAADRHLP